MLVTEETVKLHKLVTSGLVLTFVLKLGLDPGRGRARRRRRQHGKFPAAAPTTLSTGSFTPSGSE